MNVRRIAVCAAVCAIAVLLSARGRAADQVLIAAGSSWKYNDTGANLGTAWRAAAYNDAAWSTGFAQLGYGDGDEVTVLGFGGNTANRFITSYFRRGFTVANPASVSALVLRFVRDDGVVVYINGVEVTRSNMPSGTVTYTTRASTAIGGADESAWIETPVAASVLVAGTNVIAVELHQQAPTSSDISFDLELRAVPVPAPSVSVTLTSPANHAIVNTTSVTFSATASAPAGLVNATLHIGGSPRTVTFSGSAQVQDAQITSDTPSTPAGSNASLKVDGLSPHAHTLMKFPALVGGGAGQVPAGAIVTSATLRLNCTNAGYTMQVYRLTQDWIEDQATWNQRASGVAWAAPGADGAASNAGVALPGDCTTTGQRLVDLTRFVQEWTDGASNFGVVMADSGSDGVDFMSSESATSPLLTVVYKDRLAPVQAQALSGTDAVINFIVDLPFGQTYFWNVEATDTNGTVQRAASEFDVTIDTAAPDAPVLISPSDGAFGVDPAAALVATVSDPGGGALTASVEIRKATAPEFTIIALPDTQHYSEAFPAIFTSQTQWIVNQKAIRNIVFVTHEGDIVEHNTNVTEWERANTSMSLLDGVVPYGMGPGNHDQPTTLYNQYFPFTRYQNQAWYGGHYQNLNDNNYQLFSGGGLDFVIVHLEFCPPAGAVTWARSVLAAHSDRIGMMTTHAYLNESVQRTTHGCTSTQYLWDDLAMPSPNLHFMLSGHVHDESRRVDIANGHAVFQMLADYQDRASGGEGWLRILRFVPAEDKIYVQTYSPWLDRFETDANSEFTLDFPMSTPFDLAGPVSAQSGGQASVPAPGLQPATTYEWQMTVTNANGRSRVGPLWTFTTGNGNPVNQPPAANADGYTVQGGSTLSVTAPGVLGNDTDAEGATLTAVLASGTAHGNLALNANGSFSYVPTAGYTGPDAFSYRASDGSLTSAAASVDIMVTAPPPVNAAPTVATAAAASPNPVTGTTTSLSALGADDAGESGLTYTWVTTGTPPAAVTFSANGTNGAKNTVATFTRAGSYSLQVTIRDAGNLTVTSSTNVTVAQTITAVAVTPANASVVAGGTQAFSATGTDQFNQALTPQPGFGWTVSGGGTINASGLFTAGATPAGPFTVTALAGGRSGNASVTVTAASSAPSYVQGATATNNANGTTLAKAFTTANTAGNLIVVAVSWGNNSTLTCSDSLGNVYAVATTQHDSVNNQSLGICYAANVKAGANTVTARFSASAPYRRVLIHEYRGVALVNPVDVVAMNLSSGSTAANAVTSTAAVTTANGNLIFGAAMDDDGVTSISAGTGFTQRLSVNNKDLVSEDLVQTTAGSIAATHTFGAAHRCLAQMVAFRRQ